MFCGVHTYIVLVRQAWGVTGAGVCTAAVCLPALPVHCCSVTVALSSTGTDMTFAWKELQGVTYQCSFNGQDAEDCELSATALDPFYGPPAGQASAPPTFFPLLSHLSSLPPPS